MKTLKIALIVILDMAVVLVACKLFNPKNFHEAEKKTLFTAPLPAKPIIGTMKSIDLPKKININPGPLIVVVNKKDKTLVVRHQFAKDTIVCYTVRTGLNPGPKMVYGDKKSPEGKYKIVAKYNSRLVRFLALNYPNEDDIAAGKTGNGIGIHYLGPEMVRRGVRAEGSSGCITVWSKEEILKLDSLLPVGTAVYIFE